MRFTYTTILKDTNAMASFRLLDISSFWANSNKLLSRVTQTAAVVGFCNIHNLSWLDIWLDIRDSHESWEYSWVLAELTLLTKSQNNGRGRSFTFSYALPCCSESFAFHGSFVSLFSCTANVGVWNSWGQASRHMERCHGRCIWLRHLSEWSST